MKKIYSFIIMALMLCVGFASCSHEEDDLFGESAAQRLNKSVDKYQKLLTSSENGWVMEFCQVMVPMVDLFIRQSLAMKTYQWLATSLCIVIQRSGLLVQCYLLSIL